MERMNTWRYLLLEDKEIFWNKYFHNSNHVSIHLIFHCHRKFKNYEITLAPQQKQNEKWYWKKLLKENSKKLSKNECQNLLIDFIDVNKSSAIDIAVRYQIILFCNTFSNRNFLKILKFSWKISLIFLWNVL